MPNKRIALALLGVLLSAALLGLGGWLRQRQFESGGLGLLAIGGVLGLLFAALLLRRIAQAGRRLPMD